MNIPQDALLTADAETVALNMLHKAEYQQKAWGYLHDENQRNAMDISHRAWLVKHRKFLGNPDLAQLDPKLMERRLIWMIVLSTLLDKECPVELQEQISELTEICHRTQNVRAFFLARKTTASDIN